MFELEDYRGAFERFSQLYDIRADMLGDEHPSTHLHPPLPPLPLLRLPPQMPLPLLWQLMLLLPLRATCCCLRF